jgi:hypothetical protein
MHWYIRIIQKSQCLIPESVSVVHYSLFPIFLSSLYFSQLARKGPVSMTPVMNIEFDSLPQSVRHALTTTLEQILAVGRDTFARKMWSKANPIQRVSPEALEDLEHSRDRNEGDAYMYKLSSWLYTQTFWYEANATIGSHLSATKSGAFWYPPNGYMGWHTNESSPGTRFYFVHCPEGGKSFFRYKDPFTGEIVTSYDSAGWTIRGFQVGDSDHTRLWHCVYSDTDRISLGYNTHRDPYSTTGTDQ